MITENPMTSQDRFMATMRFQTTDRPMLWESGMWKSTLRRWQREGVGEGNRPPEYADCDAKANCKVDFWMLPRIEEEILHEDDTFVTRRTDRGAVERTLKSADEMSMPQHLEYPVKKPADWERLKRRFDPDDPGRFPDDWNERQAQWERENPVVILQGPQSPSLFGFVREMLGPERALMAFYDEPQLVHDMMEFATEFFLTLIPKVLRQAPVTSVWWWEDMCYKTSSLISPAMFREFMLPRYKRVTEVIRNNGIDVIMVDSDGNVAELIPLWLEADINGVYPMEVAAGMDVVKLRQQYGRDLLMTGGIDKRVLAQGQKAIDQELKTKIPLAHQGGYIPHIDHSIPHDVPYENFQYYWKRKKELLEIA